jgi:hypothetical protein
MALRMSGAPVAITETSAVNNARVVLLNVRYFRHVSSEEQCMHFLAETLISSPHTGHGFTSEAAGCFGPTDAIVDIFSCCVFGFLIAFLAANVEDSIAEVFLHGDTLPDVSRWVQQIAQVANGSYDKPVLLAPLEQIEKVQFDRWTGTAKRAVAEEHSAHDRLVARYWDAGTADLPARVTGPLRQAPAGWTLHMRDFEA